MGDRETWLRIGMFALLAFCAATIVISEASKPAEQPEGPPKYGEYGYACSDPASAEVCAEVEGERYDRMQDERP